jgi:hypothetical protein
VSGVSDANPTEERTTLTTGTDLQYSTSGLRTGAAGLREVVGQSEAARAALQGASPAPGVFGLTAAGAVYAAVLESVRTARGRGLDQEGQRAGDLSGRSDAAGGMGDELTVRTEQTARTGAPR